MFDWYNIVVYPLIYILPAYVANAIPVLLHGGGPIDFGRKIFGKRIFGDNKTLIGTASAIVAGIVVGALESPFFGYMLAVGFLLALGTVFGDFLGSFIKRQLNFKSGASFPLMDQYGFYIFALIFAYPAGHLPSLYGLIFLTIITGFVHLFTNIIAHRLKLKKVPW